MCMPSNFRLCFPQSPKQGLTVRRAENGATNPVIRTNRVPQLPNEVGRNYQSGTFKSEFQKGFLTT